MAELLVHGGELVDDVLDVLDRFLGSWRPRQLVVAKADGGTGPAGTIVL